MSFAVAVIGNGVDVRVSGIPGAGNGLWATRRYEKHELITEYQGKHIDHEKALKLRKRGRHTHVRVLNSMHLYIDGLKQPEAGRGGASFANDARDPDLTNAMFIQKFDGKLGSDRVFLKALRDIKPGEEIFVSYGKTYWQSRKQDMESGKQTLQCSAQQQQLQSVSELRRSKRKQCQMQPLHRAKAQKLLAEEQSSQQSTDTVERQVMAVAAPRASRLQVVEYPRFAHIELAAKAAQSQLRALAQQRKQQTAQQPQQQLEPQQKVSSSSILQLPPAIAMCRRSARLQSGQEQHQAADGNARDSLDGGWPVTQPRSPVPVRRARQVVRQSTRPVQLPTAAAETVIQTVADSNAGNALDRGWDLQASHCSIPGSHAQQVPAPSSGPVQFPVRTAAAAVQTQADNNVDSAVDRGWAVKQLRSPIRRRPARQADLQTSSPGQFAVRAAATAMQACSFIARKFSSSAEQVC